MKSDGPEPSRRSKRIAIFLPNLGGGGAERVALTSATDLADCGHRIDLVLIEAKGDLLPLVPNNVRVVNLGSNRIIGSLMPLVRYLRRERPDCIHAIMWPVTVIAILAHRLARSHAKLVVSDQNALSQKIRRGLQRRLLNWTTRFLYPIADARIHCSSIAADDLAMLSGISRKRIEVIYNPIAPPERIVSNSEVEGLWRGPGPRIIAVGSLTSQKNHALLLRSFAKLQNRNSSLMILGEGQLRSLLEQLSSEFGIADRVIMPGFALDPWPHLASADLFVLSSDYEGFPLVLAEAMHVGLKVVSTDCISGPAEMLDDGRFGRLVPCGHAKALAGAIDAALAEPGNPQRMRARAIEMAGPAMITRYRESLAG